MFKSRVLCVGQCYIFHGNNSGGILKLCKEDDGCRNVLWFSGKRNGKSNNKNNNSMVKTCVSTSGSDSTYTAKSSSTDKKSCIAHKIGVFLISFSL